MPTQEVKSIGVLTSGGDAPGMNVAVRAVIRTALHEGLDVYAIYEGYQGMVDGGDRIRKMDWDSVSGILHQGGAPSPFDRIQATHLAKRCVDFLLAEAEQSALAGSFIGLLDGETHLTSLEDLPRLDNLELQRPQEQWWLALQSTIKVMARFKR